MDPDPANPVTDLLKGLAFVVGTTAAIAAVLTVVRLIEHLTNWPISHI
jgi:hypothetical protein